MDWTLYHPGQAAHLVFSVRRSGPLRCTLPISVLDAVGSLVESVPTDVAGFRCPVEVGRARVLGMFAECAALRAHQSLTAVVVRLAVDAAEYRLISVLPLGGGWCPVVPVTVIRPFFRSTWPLCAALVGSISVPGRVWPRRSSRGLVPVHRVEPTVNWAGRLGSIVIVPVLRPIVISVGRSVPVLAGRWAVAVPAVPSGSWRPVAVVPLWRPVSVPVVG